MLVIWFHSQQGESGDRLQHAGLGGTGACLLPAWSSNRNAAEFWWGIRSYLFFHLLLKSLVENFTCAEFQYHHKSDIFRSINFSENSKKYPLENLRFFQGLEHQ